jgi:hypothetical protein
MFPLCMKDVWVWSRTLLFAQQIPTISSEGAILF